MFDQIRANPDHPLHPYARAVDRAAEAREFANAKRLELLMAGRGRVTAITWSRSSDVSSDGPLNLPSDITFVVDGAPEDLCFGEVTCFDHLDNEDWIGARLGHEDLADRIADRQEQGDLEWRTAAIAVVAELTGIPPEQVVGFCWLVQQHVYAQEDDDGDTLYLTLNATHS